MVEETAPMLQSDKWKEDWHPVLAGRVQLYRGAAYKLGGRGYDFVDQAGLILGIANSIGRPLGDVSNIVQLLSRLMPVKVPKPGDVVAQQDNHIGIMLDNDRVMTCDEDHGVHVANWHVLARKYRIFGKLESNPDYDYYCILRGVWHGLGH